MGSSPLSAYKTKISAKKMRKVILKSLGAISEALRDGAKVICVIAIDNTPEETNRVVLFKSVRPESEHFHEWHPLLTDEFLNPLAWVRENMFSETRYNFYALI